MGWVSIKIYRFNVYKPSHDNKIVLILSKVLTKTVTFGTFPADGAQQYNTTLGPDREGKWELMDGFTIVAGPRPATSPACCIIQQRQNENNFIPVRWLHRNNDCWLLTTQIIVMSTFLHDASDGSRQMYN